jgi:hypothetical protein
MPTRRDHCGKGRAMPPGTAPEDGKAEVGPTPRDHQGEQSPPRPKGPELSGNTGGVSVTDSEDTDLGNAAGGD